MSACHQHDRRERDPLLVVMVVTITLLLWAVLSGCKLY